MKNIDYINKKKSNELGLPLDVVTGINKYYWNTVKNRMREMKSETIYVKEIGSFEVSPFKLGEYIIRLRQYIKNLRGSKKYRENKKEEIIKQYKGNYKKAVDMKKVVDESLKFKQTYKDEQNNGISETITESPSECS